ncbi:MAG TPA: T9SS type A sorting domain-containing protein [Puia sp.]|jgi:dienelactone hydrolase|nr:T9SS type A sorting domain-containing protein [Puia sp.]
MKKLYGFLVRGMLFLPGCVILGGTVNAQVQTPRNIPTGPNSSGFYEYLPAGYSSSSTLYPLIVFLHGSGEVGNGGSDLSKVLHHGPPQLIDQGKFPPSFTVNGQTFSFIVISPQFIASPTDSDVSYVIEYAISHYRVDTGRIYLTGLSMGGGATWGYADETGHAGLLAAAVPVAAGIFWYGVGGAKIIAAANLPIFAAANLNDPVEPSSGTVNAINEINAAVPHIDPPALDTIYNASGHGGWNNTYNPDSPMHNGLNIYQWMLQYTRDRQIAGGPVPLPVRLTSFAAEPAPGGLRVDLAWSTAFEENNRCFVVERSGDGSVFSAMDTVAAAPDALNGHAYSTVDPEPTAGHNFYRLAQVDWDGKVTYSGVDEVTIAQGQGALHISPNPAVGTLYLGIRNEFSGDCAVRVIDLSGTTRLKWVFQKTGASWSQGIDIGRLSAGSYFVEVSGEGFREIEAFIKR